MSNFQGRIFDGSEIKGEELNMVMSSQAKTKRTTSASKQIAARRRERGPDGMFTTDEEAASNYLLRARRKYRQYKFSDVAVQLPFKLLEGCSLVLNAQPGQESDIFYKEGERPIKFLEFELEIRCNENKLMPITVPLVACLHVYNGDSMCPVGDSIDVLPPSRKRRRCGNGIKENDENCAHAIKEPLSYRKNSSLIMENGKATIGVKPNTLSRTFQGSQFVVVFHVDSVSEPLASFVKPVWSRPFTVKSKVPIALLSDVFDKCFK